MKKSLVVMLAALLMVSLLIGCSDQSDHHQQQRVIFVSQLWSDLRADGDIRFTPPSTYVISSALDTYSVLVGIDPLSGDEFRGFIDFPLRRGAPVPLDAIIDSATLEIVINSVTVATPGDTVPMILDLVAFQPPTLTSTDFDRSIQPPLLSVPFIIFESDAGNYVTIDVTPFMEEVQRLGLPDLQVRLLLDFSAASGLIEIDDHSPNITPLLVVSYFKRA